MQQTVLIYVVLLNFFFLPRIPRKNRHAKGYFPTLYKFTIRSWGGFILLGSALPYITLSAVCLTSDCLSNYLCTDWPSHVCARASVYCTAGAAQSQTTIAYKLSPITFTRIRSKPLAGQSAQSTGPSEIPSYRRNFWIWADMLSYSLSWRLRTAEHFVLSRDLFEHLPACLSRQTNLHIIVIFQTISSFLKLTILNRQLCMFSKLHLHLNAFANSLSSFLHPVR